MAGKAVAYIRVSTMEQANEGVSLDAQEARIRAYCTMTGLELVAVIREEGVSGSVPLHRRPAGAELVLAIARKQAAHVVAVKLDRVFRDAVDALEQSRAWDRAGVALHLVDCGGQAIDTRSAVGRMFLTMLAACAELERNLTAERTAAALAHKKANREAYSPTPYGFDREGSRLVENPTELVAVERIRELAAAGASLRGIARELAAEGIAAKRGGRWHPQTVAEILRNDLYATAPSWAAEAVTLPNDLHAPAVGAAEAA
jgi:DNA invertase Pin-like site-specific DNA recombinase